MMRILDNDNVLDGAALKESSEVSTILAVLIEFNLIDMIRNIQSMECTIQHLFYFSVPLSERF